jgi:hypothetical protein
LTAALAFRGKWAVGPRGGSPLRAAALDAHSPPALQTAECCQTGSQFGPPSRK